MSRQGPRLPSQRAQHAILVAVLAVTALIYGSNLDHEFQFDDRWKILQTWRILGPVEYLDRFGLGIYRPGASRLIPNVTISMNYAWGGVNPFGYHLVSLLFHLLNVVLVWAFVRQLYDWAGEEDRGVALLSACIFALHPLNSEAVSYTNARPNLIVCTFYLAALVVLLRAFSPSGTRATHIVGLGASAILVAFALLSKEQAVTLALTAPLLLAWIDGGWDVRRLLAIRVLKTAPVILVGAVVVAFATGAAYEVHRAVVETGSEVTGNWLTYLIVTLLGQSVVFIQYLGLALLPFPQMLNVDRRPMGHLHQHLYENGQLVDGALGVVILPLLAFGLLLVSVRMLFALRSRAPVLTFCGMWIFITHAPTSVVPRGEVMVEYRTYLPMVGVCAILAIGLRALIRRLSALRDRAWLPVGALLAGLALATLVRIQVWETEETLWQDALVKNPDNPRAHDALGRVAAQRGDEDAAIGHFERALAVDPDYSEANTNLGGLLAKRGELDRAKQLLMHGAMLQTQDENAYNNLGNVLSMLGEHERAVVAFREALRIRGRFPEAEANMGLALSMQGRLERAAHHLARAVHMEPQHPRYRLMLARVLVARGEVPRAIEQLVAAVTLDERSARAHAELGKAYSYRARYAEAETHLRRALELDPRNRAAADYLAELRGTRN